MPFKVLKLHLIMDAFPNRFSLINASETLSPKIIRMERLITTETMLCIVVGSAQLHKLDE